MSYSAHSFTCGMITLTAALIDFVFDNSIAGWILLGATAIIFTLAYFTYKNEKNNGSN